MDGIPGSRTENVGRHRIIKVNGDVSVPVSLIYKMINRIPAEVSIFTSNASVEAETKYVLDQRPVTDVAILLLNRNGGVSGNAKVTLKAKDNSR